MARQPEACEVFRRSCLTLVPEWTLASIVSLALYHAALRLRLPLREEKLALSLLPLAWALVRTLVWTGQTWTATADGRLIVRRGIGPRARQAIYLSDVRTVHTRIPPLLRRLGIGHIRFQVPDARGQPTSFHWTWIAHAARLHQILDAQGHTPIGSTQPTERQDLSTLVAALIAWVLSPWLACDDYQRFLLFCDHLLLHPAQNPPRPSWAPEAVAACWMAVLRRCHIVVDRPREGGWRLAPAVRTLDDIRRRLGPEQLRQAVEQADEPPTHPHR